jgi:hypothetical protein
MIIAILIALWIIKIIFSYCCASNCPNKVWWWQDPLDWGPGADIPRPNECCPPPSSSSASAPAASPPPGAVPPPPPVVALDHTATNTNTNDCSGATIKLPPFPNGLTAIPTSCMVPGTCLVVDMNTCNDNRVHSSLGMYSTDTTAGLLTNVSGNNPAQITSTYGTNQPAGSNIIYPPTNGPVQPISPPVDYNAAGPNQFRWCLVSDTQLDVYYNGQLLGSVTKPSFPVGFIGYANCSVADTYASFQKI